MRLIDADELKKKSRCIKIGENGKRSALLENWVVSELDINAMPTVESRPNIYTEWIEHERDATGRTFYKCSHCGTEYHSKKAAFCEDCGAVMR